MSLTKKRRIFLENKTDNKYLVFILIPLGKTHVGKQNLIKKGKKALFFNQRSFFEPKQKTTNRYLNLTDAVVKPVILYSCQV